MLKRIVLTNRWQFFTEDITWDTEQNWITASGRWNIEKGPKGDLEAPYSAIVCIRTENTDA